MSFSKAKVQRFNENKDCTPSPAKYNISTQEKIKLGLICKSGIYAKKPGSPGSSEAGSVNSTPCFQTPTVPIKRKKLLGMSFRSSKETKLNEEELRDRIVECNNKDSYIRDLLEQIEEMTGKINEKNTEFERLQQENKQQEGVLEKLRKLYKDEKIQRVKEYKGISNNVQEVNNELREIRQKSEDLKKLNFVELSKLLADIKQIQQIYNQTVAESQKELEEKSRTFEEQREEFLKKFDLLQRERDDEFRKFQEKETHLKQQHSKEIETLKCRHKEEKDDYLKKLEESEAKINQLEENFKDVHLLTELQMKEKMDEIETSWKLKLEAKEKESEAILKECQAISEYNIFQCEIEKNQIKNKLEEKIKSYEEIPMKNQKLEEEISNLKTAKHAYALSITTFKDTIEVLKKRLINSDRDVEQLKEELEKNEEKVLAYERKCAELTTQLHEVQMANEEYEMQYESTLKIMRNEIKTIEADLLRKVEQLKEESKQLKKDKKVLDEVWEQSQNQQIIIVEAHTIIAESSAYMQTLEDKQAELASELKMYKQKLDEESGEAAEYRKKFIEKSGKYDELAHQFEQILQDLDQARAKIEELQNLIGPYKEQLEQYQNELKLLNEEKQAVENEVKDLGLKYAELLGHHNHHQKVKHVTDLKMKSTELFQKNVDLEYKNSKLSKTVEKLMKEIEDLRKPGKKLKVGGEDKENLGSPKCIKGVQSPAPLKDKN